uniref:Uncharacterized protein n=1 Tax=Setaria digitata TaxID=48799 RepID=A0A915Q178_9BILA
MVGINICHADHMAVITLARIPQYVTLVTRKVVLSLLMFWNRFSLLLYVLFRWTFLDDYRGTDIAAFASNEGIGALPASRLICVEEKVVRSVSWKPTDIELFGVVQPKGANRNIQ